MQSVPSNITKTYPQRGPLQQFRFVESTAFTCFRCGETKKSKLITIYGGNWSRRLCNGCYGRLLSLYEIKARTLTDDQSAEELATALLSMVAVDDQRQAERLFRAAESRTEFLSAKAVRFIATAEHVAKSLQEAPQLEWSPAVMGLCKAMELEIVERIARPLASRLADTDLSSEKGDKDIGRVASFCANPARKPPEMGAIAHFLQTCIHSEQRRANSVLLGSFLKITANWTGSNWILSTNGLPGVLTSLTANFRNRAAHIDELCKQDYINCRELIVGPEGAIWKLLIATQHHK